MFIYGPQAALLLFDGDKMLKSSERDCDQGESFIYAKINHISLNQDNELLYRLGLLVDFLLTLVEHEGRHVKTRHFTSG